MKWLVVFVYLSLVSGKAVENDDPTLSRVLNPTKLSDESHVTDDGEHDADYDHEAFLGDDADEFKQLTPEESRNRLSIIVDRIDTNGDGFVTEEELKAWIQYTQQKYTTEDVENQWALHNPEKKDTISWKEYRKLVYGFLDDEKEDLPKEDKESNYSYQKMELRDERRWRAADEDADGYLTMMEFKFFLHPEDAQHMRDIIVTETLEDIDKDNDGKISLEEYINDMYNGDADSQPDWVISEKEQFKTARDADGDGFMGFEEVKEWIVPSDFDHSEAESKHLIYESDTNNDSKLTKVEILAKYDLFVGSQATEFGEALTKHDEF